MHNRADVLPVIDRIHTACLTLRCLPADGPRAYFSTWPAYIRREWWDWGNELSQRTDADIARRFLAPVDFTPTPHQVEDCLPALKLLDGIDKTARMVIALRAALEWNDWRGGWRWIASQCGISHEHARRLHWESMVLAWERSR